MSQAFIIIQIGNPELDRVCEEVFVPALRACGLEPRRVDKHTEGGLLKSEIIDFILNSDIIIADLTNERPNCYLEVGYAMGVDKFKNLILSAKEDHNPDSPNHHHGGPKVHFDLIGYDVLFWDSDRLEDFRVELEKRIRRRQAVIAPAVVTKRSPWDEEWLEKHREVAQRGLDTIGLAGFMEVRFSLWDSKLRISPEDLLKAAKEAVIRTFGWPFAVVLDKDEFRPKPKTEGIVAEIGGEGRDIYDYWALMRNGNFYLLKSLSEDSTESHKFYFNIRIARVTEALLYCARIYSQLGVHSGIVSIGIRHGGLKGRVISRLDGMDMPDPHSTTEDEFDAEIQVQLTEIESNLVGLVKHFTSDLFMLFDYFSRPDDVYENIVDNFVRGRVV